MKQLLLALIAIQFGVNVLHAQESNPYEETTWNVIRERLFNGKNSKAFRFEDDIRFELKGDVSSQDSFIFKGIIIELNKLIEVVNVELVKENGNFIFTINPPQNGISSQVRHNLDENKVLVVEIEVSFDANVSNEEKRKFFNYHTFKHLTQTFEPKFGRTGYGGFFDSPTLEQAKSFHQIDKEFIQKLYSKDFYTQLKKNTVNKKGYLFYLNLRYQYWVKKLSTSIAIILTIIGLLYLLSKETSTNRILTFWDYFKKGILILFAISIIYMFLRLPAMILILHKKYILIHFVASSGELFSYGVFAIVLMYFSERFWLNKCDNFFQKQLFIFTSTTFIILSCYAVISIPAIYFNARASFSPVNYTSHLNLSIVFSTITIASLRILYNVIKSRIQGLVNAKDVELAKMKELKNQAELNALHSRINPHFLYNSLNSIASLAHINPDKTENMATGLSELFRYSINKENKTFVSVGEELEMVRKYLEIEKTRFEDKLIYTIEAQDNVIEKLIPKFLIQPLAENAIKHGLSKIKGVGKITISVNQKEKALVITIFDNGPDFPEEPVSGYGLQNLNDKLEIIYGNDAFINWENGENKHFRITLKNQFKV